MHKEMSGRTSDAVGAVHLKEQDKETQEVRHVADQTKDVHLSCNRKNSESNATDAMPSCASPVSVHTDRIVRASSPSVGFCGLD
jgi:hypothetical protein